MRKRPALAVLLFAVQFVVAYAIATPIGEAFNASFGGAGISASEMLNPVLLVDFFQENAGLFGTVFGLIVLAIPLLLVWNSCVGVGLAHALRDGAVRSFWAGVSVWFWPGLGLTALYAVAVAIWTVAAVILGSVLAFSLSGEVAVFWGVFVVVPSLWIAGLAIIDLELDYARIGMVTRDQGVFESAWFGVRFGLGRRAAQLLYLTWFFPALILTVLPAPLEAVLGASVIVFVVQQLVILGRHFVTVGWIGSQVAFHEDILFTEETPTFATAVGGAESGIA